MTRTDIYNIATDNVLAENAVISTYDNVVNELFKQNEWLDLYIPHIDVKEYVGIERTEDSRKGRLSKLQTKCGNYIPKFKIRKCRMLYYTY